LLPEEQDRLQSLMNFGTSAEGGWFRVPDFDSAEAAEHPKIFTNRPNRADLFSAKNHICAYG
jgi:hypothetical protein